MAVSYHQSSQYHKALPIFISLSKKFQLKDDISSYALCQLKIADIIRNYGGVNLALELLNKNEKLIEVRLEKSSVELAQNYVAKAEALYSANKLTEFKAAIFKSIAIKTELNLSEKYFAEDYFHLARYYKEMPNQNDSCYFWIQKSLRLAKDDKSLSSYILPKIYNLIGYYYHPASISYFGNKKDSLMHHFDLSRKYYDSASIALKKQIVPDKLMASRIYHNLGNSYSNEAGVENKMELLHLALIYYRRSQSLYEKLGSPTEMALKDWVIGRAYERLKQYDSAIVQFQKGIARLIPGFEGHSMNDLPLLQPTLNDSRFISLLSIKANNLLHIYKQNQDSSALLLAYKHYVFLLKFNQYLLSKSVQEQELTYWNYLHGSNAYQLLISTAYELFTRTNDKDYIANAYGLIASAKYAWLNRNDIEPNFSNSINTSVLKEEIKLVKINILQKVKGIDSVSLQSVLPSIPEQMEKASLSNLSLASRILDTLSVRSLQNELEQKNEVLIDYYVWGNELYSLIITANGFEAVKQNLPNDFNASIWKLINPLSLNKPNQYARSAHSIYLQTLDSLLLLIPKTTKRIVVCPDGNLQNIPWDALVSDTLHNDSFKSLNYLLNHYAIRTVITPKHLLRRNKKCKGYLGVSSNFNQSIRFSQIPFSNDLVKTKAKEFDGRVLKKLSEMPSEPFEIKVFHIAAHVVNDSIRPYRSSIFINDNDSITVEALSNSRIRPQLAILNGCQTGSGTYYQSEGTISFARSLYSLGAESVLMTLWSVDDKATAEVLKLFYHEMESGNDLDDALRNAKMSFLNREGNSEMTNPYYWAGLQLSGKAEPIVKTKYLSVVFLVIVFTLLAIVLIYWLKSKKWGTLFNSI
ncbi:MAG: CHAT domain-containing protein [Cytophagales bacterium]|nr:CHAT domain-containing protein [Cytophagales bacterium]